MQPVEAARHQKPGYGRGAAFDQDATKPSFGKRAQNGGWGEPPIFWREHNGLDPLGKLPLTAGRANHQPAGPVGKQNTRGRW